MSEKRREVKAQKQKRSRALARAPASWTTFSYSFPFMSTSLTLVLQKPMYVKVPESEKPQEFHIEPEETVLLELGKYFISFQIVDCNEKALEEYLQIPESERNWSKMRLSTLLYFKSSYTRKTALGKMEHLPVNIGMVVKGVEYK